MRVRRFQDAKPYEAPNHFDMKGLRLQGFEEGGPEKFWTGLSHFLPGGGAGPDSSPLEKVYVVVAGEVTVRAEGEEVVLGPLDSIYIGGNVVREVVNASNTVATMIVIMPYPEGAA
ncbi:cupin domain-containing protein [Muricoccus aerilatus]|uniref:cupin domain-containing protein n=1 Tax=Muricoccus aerilatus TaxID=452982 RepID=UPI0005C1D8BC|nr:cupin domain-containing protein [Roseomonas aerilata]